ncbi:hypothetical protein DYQ86_12580 [Acidobacteria bacterium AB60]|nr:hypothetical protein DYQ86_12580 [Acidobacteria bacterium AB60]
MVLAAALPLLAQGGLTVPRTIEAGSAFSVQSSGSGQGTLYIVGPGQVLKRDVQLGSSVNFEAGALYNAGHYLVFLSGSGDTASLDVLPSSKVADVSFLARPSRLPVGLRDGITGAVYLFDSYQNLVTKPTTVDFQLSTPGSAAQNRNITTRDGAAWIAVDSSPKEGAAQFIARVGDIATKRIIGQVPGDPCGLQMTARPAGPKVALETAPVRDCSGNAVPDGTIITFTESFNGGQTTVDVPLKRGIAKVEMPAYPGATITVASGVVLGNQIRWGR